MQQRCEPARGVLSAEVAVVTGAGRGVGRAIAQELAAAGASVVLSGRTASEIDAVANAIVESGGRSLAVPTDVTDEEQIERLVRATRDEFGPPTLLVNNAATWASVGPVEASDPDAWWTDVEVSLRGTFLCTRAVLRCMLEVGRGRIVNLASRAGTVPRPNASGYAAAKAAVISFTGSVAEEVRPHGVTVFAVSPGFVRTQMIEGVSSLYPELAERVDDLPPELAGRLVVDIATGQLDVLSGSLIHVLDDVDALLEEARIAQTSSM